MSSEDNRIVNMKFNNAQFERGISESLNSLDKLENKLQFKQVGSGILDKLSKGFGTLTKTVDTVGSAANEVTVRFDAMNVAGMAVIQNLTNKVTDFASTLARNMTIQPMMDGFNEYEEKIDAIQTIMSNTKWKYEDDTVTQLHDVNGALDELNTYADQTIYNFTDMTRAIGQFTTAGMDVKEATTAIKGMSNLAAYEGVNNESLSRAEYQLSQMLQTGSMKLMDWNSVVNAGMGGKVFQDQLIKAAQEIGQEVPQAVLDGTQSFRDSLSTKGGDSWVTKDVVEQAMANMADNKDMQEAATKIRTFSKLVGTLREEIGSDWTNTWEEIVGDYGQATDLFTMINDRLGGLISESGKLRVEFIHNLMNITDPDSGNFATGREMLVNVIDNLIGDIEYLTKAIKNGAEEVFGVIKPEQVYSYLIAASYYTDEFRKKVDQVSPVIVNVTKVAFGLLKIGISGVKTLIGAAQPLFNAVKRLGLQIFDLVASFGEWLNSDEAVAGRMQVLGKIAEWAGHIFEIFGKAVDGVGKTLKEFTDSSGFAYILDGLEHLASAAGKIVTAIVDAADQVFTHINGKTLSGYAKGFDDIAINIDNVASKIQGPLTSIFTVFFKIIDLAIKAIGQVIKIIKPIAIVVTNAIGAIIQAIGKLIDGIKTGAITISKIGEKIKELFGIIKDFVTGPVLSKLSGAIDKIFGDGTTAKLVDGIKVKVSELPEVFDKLKDSIKKLPDVFVKAKDSTEKFADVGAKAINKVFGEGTTTKIANTTKSTGSKVKSWFKGMTDHAKSFLADPSFSKVYNVFDFLDEKIGKAIKSILKHFMSLEDATAIGEKVHKGLSKAAKKILNVLEDFKDDAPAMFKKAFVKMEERVKDFAKGAPVVFRKGITSIGKTGTDFAKSIPSKFLEMLDDIKKHFTGFKKSGTSSASLFFASIGNLFSNFKQEGTSSVSSFFSSIKNLFSGFKSDFPNSVSGVADKIKSIASKLFSELKDIFAGKGGNAKNVFTTLGDNIAKPFKDGSLLKTIKEFFSSVGTSGKNFLEKVVKTVKDKFPALATTIVTKFGSAFSALLKVIKNLWDKTKTKFTDEIKKIGEKFSGLFTGKNNSVKTIGSIEFDKDGLSSLSDQLTTIGDKGDSFADAAKKVADGFVEIGKTYGGLFKVVASGILAVLIVTQFRKLIAGLKNLIPVAGTVSSAISSITAPFTQISKNIKTLRIIEFATAIAILASSLVKVSQINANALWQSLGAISLLVGEMVVVMKLMDKLGTKKAHKSIKSIVTGIADPIQKANPKEIAAVGLSLIGFAAAIRILAGAMNKIAQISSGTQIAASLGSVTALVVELTIVGHVMAKDANNYGSFIKSAASLVIFAMAISKVVSAVKKLASIGDPDTMILSVGGVAILMGELAWVGTILANSQKTNGSFASTAGSMLIFALALIPIMRAIQVIGAMPLEQMRQGIVAVAGIMAGLAGIAALLGGKSFKKASQILEETSDNSKKLKIDKLLSISAALLSFAIAITAVTKAMQKLGSMDILPFFQGIAGFAVISGVMVASIKAISSASKDLLPASKAMLKYGAAMGLLTLSVVALSKVPLTSLAIGLGAMGAEILIAWMAIKLLGDSADKATTAATTILKIAGALTVFGLGISLVMSVLTSIIIVLSAIPVTTVLQGVLNLAIVLGTTTAALILITQALEKFGGGIPAVADALKVFVGFAASLIVMSVAIDALGVSALFLSNVPWWGIAEMLGILALAFVGFAVVATIAEHCKVGVTLLGKVLEGFAKIIGGIGKIVEGAAIALGVAFAMFLAAAILGKDKISAVLDDIIALMPKFSELLAAGIQAIIDGVLAKMPDIAESIVTGLLEILISIDSHLNQILAVMDDILYKLFAHLGEQLAIGADKITELLLRALGDIVGKIPVIGDKLQAKLDEQADQWGAKAEQHMSEMTETAKNAFSNGITSAEPSIFNDAAKLPQAAADGMASTDTSEQVSQSANDNIISPFASALGLGTDGLGEGVMSKVVGSMFANSDATPAGDNTASTYSNGYSGILGMTGATNEELLAQFQQSGIDISALTEANGANVTDIMQQYGIANLDSTQGFEDAMAQIMAEGGDTITGDVDETGDEVVASTSESADQATDAVQNGTDEAVAAVDNADGELQAASEENCDAVIEPMEEASDQAQQIAGDAADGAVNEIQSRDGDFNSSGVGNANEYTSGLDTAEGGSESAGDNASQGFLNSAGSYGGSFWSKGWDLAKNFLGGLFGGLDEHSPSKKTAWAADMAILGFTNTIHDGLKDVAISGTTQGGAYTEALQEALQQADDLADGVLDYQPTITPIVDLSQVRAGYNAINSMKPTSSMLASTISRQNGSSSAKKMTDSLNSVATSLGSIQGGNNNVYITVNAAEGQSANDIADIVVDKINTQMRRRKAAY